MIVDFHQHLVLPLKNHAHIMFENQVKMAIVIPFPFKNGEEWNYAIGCIGMGKKPQFYKKMFLKPMPQLNSTLQIGLDSYIPSQKECKFLFVPWIVLGLKDLYVPENHPSILKFIPIFDNVEDGYYQKMCAAIEMITPDIVMIHTGWGSSVEKLFPVMEEFPDIPIVLAHMKEDTDQYHYDRLKALKNYENVYLETSYVPHSKRIWQYVRAGYGDRLLFGSDFRNLDDLQSLRGFIRVIEEADITEEEQENIFQNNALKLLNIIYK